METALLLHPDAHAPGQHLDEVLGEAAHGGESAPRHQPASDDPAPAVLVGHAPQRDAAKSVEDREDETLQDADLRVGDLEIATKRTDDEREDLAINKREDVHQRKHADDVPGVARRRIRGLRRFCRTCRSWLRGHDHGNSIASALPDAFYCASKANNTFPGRPPF